MLANTTKYGKLTAEYLKNSRIINANPNADDHITDQAQNAILGREAEESIHVRRRRCKRKSSPLREGQG